LKTGRRFTPVLDELHGVPGQEPRQLRETLDVSYVERSTFDV
jgi:hypothetical protein